MSQTRILFYSILNSLYENKCIFNYIKLHNVRALTLVGQNREIPVLDPLAVQHLINQLFLNGSRQKMSLKTKLQALKKCLLN